MSSTPWQTDKWFVSPWNFQPEVRAGFDFPPSIQIHDITLRDGEQQAGVVLRKDEKIRIAEKMAEAGVHRIEAGTPVVSKEDEAAIREIVKRKLGPKVFALARCIVEDVKKAIDCGIDGCVIEIPCSEHIIKYAYGWPLEKAIDMAVKATAFAHSQGVYTVFFPIDATRTEINWYLNVIERVARDGHMDALAMVDTTGVLSPHGATYMVKKTRERIKDKPLETHFHGDFGLGVANTIAGLAAGCSVAHVTSMGVGERAGNAPLEETVMALKLLYGVDVGIKTEHLYGISKLVRKLMRIPVPKNRPIVGDNLFDIESGIVADWYRNCGDEHLLEVFPWRPEVAGHPKPRVVLGKGSGQSSVQIWLDELGVKVSDSQRLDILWKVKEASLAKKGMLTKKEFRAIVESVVGA